MEKRIQRKKEKDTARKKNKLTKILSPGRSDIHHDEPLKFQIPNTSFFFHGNPQNPTEKETLILKMNFAKSSHAINTAQKPNTHTSAWKAGEI